jgi:hypothetical protein
MILTLSPVHRCDSRATHNHVELKRTDILDHKVKVPHVIYLLTSIPVSQLRFLTHLFSQPHRQSRRKNGRFEPVTKQRSDVLAGDVPEPGETGRCAARESLRSQQAMAVPRDKTAGSTEWLRKRVERLLACPEVLTRLKSRFELLRLQEQCMQLPVVMRVYAEALRERNAAVSVATPRSGSPEGLSTLGGNEVSHRHIPRSRSLRVAEHGC